VLEPRCWNPGAGTPVLEPRCWGRDSQACGRATTVVFAESSVNRSRGWYPEAKETFP